MLDAEQCNNIKKELSKALSATVSHGYFIIDKKKGKNSVVGFLIYNIKEQTRVSYLLFVLIDKKHQNQSFGTTLMQKYMEDIHNSQDLLDQP
jgi:RimJ/RimL family protein N-acetyltransferase